MTFTRDITHWRSLPQLSIAEAATVAGVCPRTIEAHMHEMTVRAIGRKRFVTTDSFRRWLGENVEATTAAVEVDRRNDKRANAIMRRLG